jgi:hypothetical protein
MSGCMKNGDIDFPKDQPDPITPTNPNGKRLMDADFSVTEYVVVEDDVPVTVDTQKQ